MSKSEKKKMKQTIEMVPVKSIIPDPNQPRTEWDLRKEHIESLKLSYSKHGIIEPIEVDEDNMIVLGECRWRAAKRFGLKQVPIRRIKTPIQQDRLERQLIDDAQRGPLSAVERMWAYTAAVCTINKKTYYSVPTIKAMYEKGELERLQNFVTVSKKMSGGGKGRAGGVRTKAGAGELARITGISQQHISNHLLFWNKRLPQSARDDFLKGHIKYTDFNDLLRIKEDDIMEVTAKSLAEDRRTKPRKSRISARDRGDVIRKIESRGGSKELMVAAAKAEIEPEEAEALSEIPAEVQSEAIKIIKEQPTPFAKKVVARQIAIEVPRETAAVKVSKEKIAELRSQAVAHDKRMAEVDANPLVQEAQRIYKSSSVLFGLQGNVCDAFCPICGESAEEHLRFTCHPDMTIKESYNRTMENHTAIVKRRKSGGANN